jgi:acyl-CoA-binding protein
MTEIKPRLGTSPGNLSLGLAEREICREALRFITNGLRDYTGMHAEVQLDAFESAVDSRLLDNIAGGGLVLTKKRIVESLDGLSRVDAQKEAYTALMMSFKAERAFPNLAPPLLGFLGYETERELALAATGMLPTGTLEHDEKVKPLQAAFEMAHWNIHRAEQRLVLLSVLANDLLFRHLSGKSQSQAAKQYHAAYDHLYSSRGKHVLSALALGTLMGAEALVRNKQLVASMYGDGMALIHLLNNDGQHPGAYPAHTEDNLRSAIKQAL